MHKIRKNTHEFGNRSHRSAGEGGEGVGADGTSQETQHFDFEFGAAES